jgi:hypothetical protein
MKQGHLVSPFLFNILQRYLPHGNQEAQRERERRERER